MKVTGFNHLSIGTRNLVETVKFDETVLGMQTIPSYNFGFKTKYLRCGDLQLHIFEFEDHVPFYQHFAVDVDDFHAAYDAAKAIGALDRSRIPEMKRLTEFAEQSEDGLIASLYLDRPHLKPRHKRDSEVRHGR